MKEERAIFYHGYYEISNYGIAYRVKSGKGTYPGKIIKPCIASGGYLQLHVWRHNRRKIYSVHILVARKFLGPCPPGKEVHHIDENPANNCVDNLKYVTHKKNINYAVIQGKFRGENSGTAVLNWKIVRIYLAKEFGVIRRCIGKIVNNETWREIVA